jgi:hypothetical protein
MSVNLVPEEVSFIISSNPDNGASNVSSDGHYFEVNLEDALQIPKSAMNVNLSVQESTVWWTIPNIVTGQNDKFYITGPNKSDVSTNFVITIPQGLYDLTGLNQAIQRELETANAKISPDPLVSLTGDESTQKVEIRFNYTATSVDFTQLQTFREIIGFNSAVIGPFATVPTTVLAPNVAQFNTINYFLLHSDLVGRGIRFNKEYNQTIAQILIDTSPGTQIVSKPFNPSKINCQELAGALRKKLRFWLTDDKNRPVNTNQEYYSARIVIDYLVPKVLANV